MRTALAAAVFAALAFAAGGAASRTGQADPPHFRAVRAFAQGTDRFVVYGDARGVVHVVRADSAGTVEEWESAPLESAVGGIFCDDLDGDGAVEVLAYTGMGSIVLFDLAARQRIWSNDPDEFGPISCLTVAHLDDDPQQEIVFCARSRLYVYDSRTQMREWQSNEEYEAEDLEVGDVDDDGQLEVVLNTGYVLDARFHDLEWRTQRFGERIALYDLDDDGVLEIIGEFSGGVIKVYDADLRREKW